ncbi:lipid II-degrading bacteriocin, partial [Escherichia coli]|nr:lipid II-degrading bacteriocin [Escherichia coli]MDW7050896.1 lipid II-degrading bacteriocin [Escherichia coli]
SLKTSIKTITYLSDTGCLEIQGASLLGNITLKTEGTLTISANGSWTYNGVVRSYDDKYDFNASTHRGVIGESLTRLGAMFSGKEYQILLPGEIHIKESGKR